MEKIITVIDPWGYEMPAKALFDPDIGLTLTDPETGNVIGCYHGPLDPKWQHTKRPEGYTKKWAKIAKHIKAAIKSGILCANKITSESSSIPEMPSQAEINRTCPFNQ